MLFFALCFSAESQTFYSRNNFAGVSKLPSTWEGTVPEVSSELLVGNNSLIVQGYLVHGTDWSRANATFTGTTATIVVEDTLRVHGNLTMKSGSSLHIKPGGVLIVQSSYNQDADVTFKNEGSAVFLGDWRSGTNPSATTNTGSMYVAGTVTTGGSSIIIKPYSQLIIDSPSLYEFSRTHVILAEDCGGTVSGSVSFSELGATILRWEVSTDFFKTKTNLNNTTGSQSYTDLIRSTSFRAYYRTVLGVEKYSPGSTIIIQGPLEASELPSAGYLASWPMNGDALDVSGKGNHGTVSGAVLVNDQYGKPGKAYSFDGTDDFISTSTQYPAPGPNQFTISLWFNTTTAGGKIIGYGDTQTGQSVNNDRHIFIDGLGRINFGIWPQEEILLTTSESYTDGQWHHVAASLSSAGMKLYVDGVLKGSNPAATAGQNFSGYWKIGYDRLQNWVEAGVPYHFKGSVDDVHIFERELTGEEVYKLNGAGSAVVCEGESLQLYAATVSSASYSWSGPNGFTSKAQNPVILNSSQSNAGTYWVTIRVNNCLSQRKIEVTVNPASQGGTLSGSSTVCKGSNSGTINLAGHTGNILRWESSEDADFISVTTINSTATQISYSNLSNTTWYRAVVKNGLCSEKLSTTAAITVSDVAGGSVSGAQTFCTANPETPLTLSGHSGSIIRWERSVNDFMSAEHIAHTGTELTVPAPGVNTRYRVLLGNGGVCADEYSAEFELTGDPSLNNGALAVSRPLVTVADPVETFLFSANAKNNTGNGNDAIVYGALPDYDRFGMANSAYKFNGTTDYMTTPNQYPSPGPQVFTISVWFKTSSVTGGSLISYGSVPTGTTANHDRQVYMDNSGIIYFGVYPTTYRVIKTTAAYNDGKWHHVIASLSSEGMKLYVDNVLQSQNTDITSAQSFAGYWKMGHEDIGDWPGKPTSEYFNGSLDDIYVFTRALSPAETGRLYGEGAEPLCEGETLSLTAATVPGATYLWAGPGEFSSPLQNPSIANITSAGAGTYSVKIELNGCVLNGNTEVNVTPATIPGVVTSDKSRVCVGTNSGTLTLEEYVGQIIRWESSGDGFNADIQTIAHTQSQLGFENINSATSYRAIVKNGTCGEEQPSVSVLVQTDAVTVGGNISGSTEVCKGNNSGTLSLSGHTGSIVQWESSATEDFSAFTIIASTSASLSYENLAATTWYRARLKNGSCAEALSASAKITVSDVAGGILEGNATVCEGSNSGTINLSGQIGSVVRWESSVDNFTTITVISNTNTRLSYSNLTETTLFRAITGNGGICKEAPSSVAEITVEPKPEGGFVVASQDKVCSGFNSGTLSLQAHIGNIIRWESSSDNFTTITVISNTTTSLTFENLSLSTAYRAVVTVGVCAEVASEVATIEVVPQSKGGILSGSAEVCKGNNSGNISLSAFIGNIIRWESSPDAEFTVVNTIESTESQISYLNLTATTWYRAVTENSPCSPAYSSVAAITISETEGGVVSGSMEVCMGSNSGTLNLSGYTGNIIRWEKSEDNFQKDIQQINNTATDLSFLNLTATTSYRAVLGNGICAPVFSEAALITVVDQAVGGMVVAGTEAVCTGVTSFTLILQDYSGSIIRWERSTDNFATHHEIINHTSQELLINSIAETNSYRAIVKSGNCSEIYSAPVMVKAEETAKGGTIAGGGRVLPGENSGTLSLEAYEGEILYWETSADNFVKDVKKIANTAALLPYNNIGVDTWYRASVQKNSCDPVYSDVAAIFPNTAPVATDDYFEAVAGVVFYSDISLAENDSDPDKDPVKIQPAQNMLTPAGNELDIDASGKIIFRPQQGFTGKDSVRYELCDIAGEVSLCSYGYVVFQVKEKSVPVEDLVIYKGLSPNQDNKNDKWYIDRIEYFPDNYVQIFNANGILVFDMHGYDNADRAFAGIGNSNSGSSGKELPEATYYYRISFTESKVVLKGYIILNR